MICKDNKATFDELLSRGCSVSNYNHNIQNLVIEIFNEDNEGDKYISNKNFIAN